VDAAATQSNKVQEDVTALRSNVSDLKPNAKNTASSQPETQTNASIESREPIGHSLQGHYDHPGRVLAGETVYGHLLERCLLE
jgi:hypothetical protein